MSRLFGKLRGGLGISVILVGMLLAASTGIVGATVVTMGLLSLPTMLKQGYDPKISTGLICASGTLGQIIPPSIVLVLLGDVLSNAYQQAQLDMGIFSPETISVGDLFIGALIPGLSAGYSLHGLHRRRRDCFIPSSYACRAMRPSSHGSDARRYGGRLAGRGHRAAAAAVADRRRARIDYRAGWPRRRKRQPSAPSARFAAGGLVAAIMLERLTSLREVMRSHDHASAAWCS
jgi:hypothetical protein